MFSFYILDGSDQVSSQEEDTNSNYSNSPRFTRLNSQTTGLNPEKLDICKEEQASCEWTESEARVNKLEIYIYVIYTSCIMIQMDLMYRKLSGRTL